MSSKRVLITSRHDLTERMLLFDEHFDERVKLAFELDSNVFLYYYNGTTKISEFGGLSDGEKLSFSTEDIPDGVYTDIENAVKNGRAKRVNADDKRKFKQLEQTANSLYSNQQSEPSPQIIKSPKGRVGRQQKPLDITGAPGYEKLGEEEKTLCTALRLTPQLYLDIKTVLTTECSKQGYLKKQQARSLIKIDVNKTAAIFDFLQEQGWINNNASMIQTAQTHHQIQQHHAQHAVHNNSNDLNAYQAGYLQSIQQQQQQQGGGYLQQEANYMISQTTSNSNSANNSSNLNLTQAHELIQNGVQGIQGISQAHSMQSQQQRLSLLPNQQQQQPIMVPKFKQEHPNLVQQPPTKKVKRENPIIPQNTNSSSSSSIQTPHSSIPNKAIHSSNNGQTQQNVVYERVYFSYQTKGNAPPPPHQHPVFYAIPTQTPQHTSSHLQQTTHHHIQQTNSHIVGGAHANNQHSHQTTHHTQQQQFSSTYTTPQSDDNIQHPPQDSSSGEEPVLDLWDPAALQQTNQDQDHWGSVLDVQARDSMNMPAFNPNYPQANLQYTQYVPDDVANLPFPTSHQ